MTYCTHTEKNVMCFARWKISTLAIKHFALIVCHERVSSVGTSVVVLCYLPEAVL